MASKPKVLVLGLDGATWTILDPWIAEGKLPTFKRLIELGSYGDLQSSIPPVTSPAWKCYSTGKNPGKLGVFWWVGFDRENGKLTFPNSYSFKSRDLWDYLGDAGKKVGIVNMPTTYPPKSVNGFMVSGFGMPMDRNFNWSQTYTWPKSLQQEIEQRYKYRVGIAKLDMDDKSEVVNEVENLIEMRFNLAEDKLEEGLYDFIHLTIFYINVLQHHFGRDKVVEDAWRLIDMKLKSLIDKVDNIIIISDHGMMEITASFAINTWLKEHGYLKMKKSWFDVFGKVIFAIDEVTSRVFKSNRRYLSGGISHFVPWLAAKIPSMFGTVGTSMIDVMIDWDSSEAMAVSMGPIYINTKKVGASYDKLRNELIHGLENLKEPYNGQRIIHKAYKKEDIYTGQCIGEAPDIVIQPNDNWEIYGGLEKTVLHLGMKRGWTTGNHPMGMFLAYGSDIGGKGRINGARIIDIAPTVLHIMGIALPDDMDGTVLDIFRECSEPAQTEICYQEVDEERGAEIELSKEEEEAIKRRLRELGYLA